MNLPIKITTAALIALSIPLISHAQTTASVTILTDAESLQQRNEKQYFSQDGLSGEEARVIPGAGAGMPLKSAAKKLVPAGWQVVGSGEFDRALISWRGGLTWPQILRDVAQREKIYISLDWVKKVASINVPSTHASLVSPEKPMVASSTAAALIKNDSPVVTSVKKPELKVHERSVAQKITKLDTEKLASESLKKETTATAVNKQKAAEKNKDAYIANLERERASLIAKNDAAIQESKRHNKDALTKNPTAASIDAVKLHQQYKDRTVLPFNSSFEYFSNGGHSDRFKAEFPATYIAKPGTIEDVVTSWADAVGYGVEYRAGVQHTNDYQIEIKGTFFDASVKLIEVFEKSDRPLNIEFFPDVQVSETKKGLVIISDLHLN